MRAHSLTLAALLLVGASSLNLHAKADTTYTDASSFLSAIQSGYYLESFDSLTAGSDFPGPYTFSGNGFSYQASSLTELEADAVDPNNSSDIALSTSGTGDLTLTFTSGNVTAIGGQFFPNNGAERQIPGDETITLADGTTYTLTATANNPQPFVGFTSAAPITSITFSVPLEYASINNLYVGTAAPAVTPVPEPSAFAMFGGMLGVGGFSLLHRRRSAR